jgi:hypothetical protein
MAGHHDDEEDYFDDDDLDALPNDTLIELENNAIQFTQAQTQARHKPPPSSDYGDDFEDENLDDAVVIDESRSTPAIVPTYSRYNAGQTTQSEQFRQQRYGTISHPDLPTSVRPNNPPIFNQPSRLPSHPLPSNRLVPQGHVSRPASQQAGLPQGKGSWQYEQRIEEVVQTTQLLDFADSY